MKNVLSGKKALVIGMGVSGRSAAKFLLQRGAIVTGVDSNKQLFGNENIHVLQQQGMTFLFEDEIRELKDFDLAVISPGISPENSLYHQAIQSGIETIGEAELACRDIRCQCLGVTGTNGKTTVTLMVEHILQKAGIKARSLGNIGTPLTSAFEEPDSNDTVFVIELSSFQLETLNARFLDAAVILNITPDHLDRYSSMQCYAQTKAGISKNLKDKRTLYIEDQCLSDFFELFEKNNCSAYGYSPFNTIHTDLEHLYHHGEKISRLPDAYKGKRSHDVENMMAAYALCIHAGISSEDFFNGLTSFQKPAHRIEFVRTVKGVNFYDDSKGTNIDAVIRAVDSLHGPIILIAGGVDKGFPYTSWIAAFKGKVKAICAIGQSKQKIQQDLGSFIPVKLFNELKEAVVYATAIAENEDNVLLSPGCSSFDMFRDYVHRGEEFQRIIRSI